MAFYYFTTDTIKQIDPDAIPDSFISYYQDLTEDMKTEIAAIHPDLYERVNTSNNDENQVEDIDFDLFEDSELSVEEQRIIDKWESISIKAWHQDTVTVEVLVCKIIPDNVRRCKIHKTDLIKKQIKYIDRKGSIYGHYGYLCPDCMDLYVEESKIEGIIEHLDKRGVKMWIQLVEDTRREWEEFVVPIEIDSDTIIYIPDTWADVDMTCPLDGGKIVEDVYKKVYGDNEVRFDACQCVKCKKIMMRSSLAQQLDLNCGKIGIPEIKFNRIQPKTQRSIVHKHTYKPDYFVQNGMKSEYDYEDRGWEELPETAIFVVSYSRVCTFEDHDTDDALVLVNVQGKKGENKKILVLVGYCEDCKKYYIAQEDYAILYNEGRPCVTVYDDTNSNYYVQSGNVFDDERKHLECLEGKFDAKISYIKSDSRYVSQYAVSSGYYDEGDLSARKHDSVKLQEQINEIVEYISKPYGYRVDLVDDTKTLTYYLGPEDIEIDGEKVSSFNTDQGREMVNYRTIELEMNGTKYKVKRRRQFDIERATLFGYMEQSDEDSIFREGLTDPYLIKVLNTRKQQHQLVDIMFTIQENQNAIVDVPLQENIIVQGCAGSGKTVVLLQRMSALKHGKVDFDFDRVMILTPNSNFNLHISGLASSLQLGYIERLSVEDYYIDLLRKYSEAFKPKYAISNEMNVNQVYVDYMYSDDFLNVFFESYKEVMESAKKIYEEALLYSPAVLKEKYQEPEWADFIFRMLDKIDDYNRLMKKTDYKGNEDTQYDALIPKSMEDAEKDKLRDFLKRIDGYTVKNVYTAVYEKASLIADNTLFAKTGKHYLSTIKGTHRYDLYLQLQFAIRLYAKVVGKVKLMGIDEGQDLSVNEYRLIKKMNGDDMIFNIYGDTKQLLKPGRGIHDWNEIKSVIDSPKQFVLNENFRNTNQITQFSNDAFKMEVLQTGVDGHKVNEILRSKFEATISGIEVGDERIAILLPTMVKKKDYLDLEQILPEHREIIGDQIGNGRICVSYVSEVKGIEFDKVYVVPNGMSLNEKYIAYTRALSELTIVFDDEIEEKIKVQEEERRQAEEKKVQKENVSQGKVNVSGKTNVKFGKVKTKKDKKAFYSDSEIGYSTECKYCGKKIELTNQEMRQYSNQGKEFPILCEACKNRAGRVVSAGKCQDCGKDLLMSMENYVALKEKGELPNVCSYCERKRQKNKVKLSYIYRTIICKECGHKFNITNSEKDYFLEKGWNLPTRCMKCRKKRRN